MEKKGFNLRYVRQCLAKINQKITKESQVPFDQFCQILNQFCILFKELNSFLGIAFSDVTQKVAIFKTNNQRFPGYQGFFSFVQMEIKNNIHILNGDNNKEKNAPKQYKKYNSTSRNLLRMMWLLTFIRSTFEQVQKKPADTKLSQIFDKAYDDAFGEKHSWLIRKGAKIAIMTSSDRKSLVQVVIGKYDEELLKKQNDQFMNQLIPVHECLWNYYGKYELVDLE